MNTGVTLTLTPDALAEPFDRLDAGDETHVRDIDILVDIPEVISVVRFHFDTGTGYETIFSAACDRDDFSAAVLFVSRANIIRCEPWGWNESGYSQGRALYWELRTVKFRRDVQQHAA
ncbi:hypothetical protein [Micromonospora avicenniae]|uniref:hypothetical protein n=1 Tax=Micromonospora avicenniae TaxID=1198245 RepID=UPI00332B2858